MRKSILSNGMIIGTFLITTSMLLEVRPMQPTEATLVQVSRQNVHQVVAITGKLAYSGERMIVATSSGVISHVLAGEGQRVAEGEAIIRMDTSVQERAIAAMVQASEKIENSKIIPNVREEMMVLDGAIRADATYTVRQVLVQENALVAAGTPVARISSNQQEIRCVVNAVDAGRIQEGMWGWIYSQGKAIGTAKIELVGATIADEDTGVCVAQVTLLPEDHLDLPEGAAVDVDVYLAGSDAVTALPLEAVTSRGTVWWVSEGRCTEIDAQVIMCDEQYAWVLLPEGIDVAIGEYQEGQQVVEGIP